MPPEYLGLYIPVQSIPTVRRNRETGDEHDIISLASYWFVDCPICQRFFATLIDVKLESSTEG